MRELSKKIHNEICSIYPTVTQNDIFEYIYNGVDNNELFFKVGIRSSVFSEYVNERFKQYRKTLPLADKNSLILKCSGYKTIEVSLDQKAYVLDKRRRLREIYFNPKAEVFGDFFGNYTHRLGEAYVKAKGLNVKDYLFY